MVEAQPGELAAVRPLRTFSYGGGVQSTAALVLAAQGVIDYPTFLFANVGDDSEMPQTIEYVHDVAVPFAEAHAIELHELHFMRLGGVMTLWERMHRGAAVTIPAFMPNGSPTQRSCTVDHKILVIRKWLVAHGATVENPAHVGLGISTDELERAKPSREAEAVNEHPLLTLGYSREDCKRIIREAGIPVPPKSACFFCPWHKLDRWKDLKRQEPDLFDKAVSLERRLWAGRAANGNDTKVYLTRYGRPLDEVVKDAEAQGEMFPPTGGDCEGGYCMT